ncbi:hypothetical protein UP09_31940 [Bradyrhizobium sp. LTSP885]|nr:hypothetical protein UP09_31940 [Bradyrhizobium sp. LTSP885]
MWFQARSLHSGGLHFVLVSFILRTFREVAMDAEKDRGIIRLWNRLRQLERAGRPTTAVRRQIEKALSEREREAA